MNKPAPMDVTQDTGQGTQPGPAPAVPAGAETGVELPERASLGRVLRDQKKIMLVALTLAVAAFWVCGQLDRWTLAGCIAGGVALGLANHLATELWLLRIITSGAQPTRTQMVVSTLVRLGVLTVVAVGFAVAFWPDGIGLLLGLAIFRLIALMMTSLVLLKELKSP